MLVVVVHASEIQADRRPPATPFADVEVFDAPTAEMRFWDRALDVLLPPSDARRDGPLRRAASAFTVIPFVNLANFSLDYQVYLLLLFHRSVLARIGHGVGIPLAALAFFSAASTIPAPFGGTLATILGGVLVVWYLAWGLVGRVAWLGLAAAPTVAALVALGHVVAAHFGLRGALVGVAGAGALLSFSHAVEPLYPPRINGTERWMPIGDWLRPDGRRLSPLRLGASTLAFLAGVVDELCAALRLLPLLHLLVGWKLGLDRARRERLAGWVERAYASENPALDYIGIGGATRIQAALDRAKS